MSSPRGFCAGGIGGSGIPPVVPVLVLLGEGEGRGGGGGAWVTGSEGSSAGRGEGRDEGDEGGEAEGDNGGETGGERNAPDERRLDVVEDDAALASDDAEVRRESESGGGGEAVEFDDEAPLEVRDRAVPLEGGGADAEPKRRASERRERWRVLR